jgi:AcrR family transcriptional regulator
LAGGSGSLYRHFDSKRELLEAGIDALLSGRERAEEPLAGPDLTERLRTVASRGLARMQEDQNLNRLLFRDLTQFPELLVRFAEEEVKRRQEGLAAFVASQAQANPLASDMDWEALACVLQSATSHFWLMTDVFGEHPTGVEQMPYVSALVELVVAMIATRADGSN